MTDSMYLNIELWTRILCDTKPKKVDIIYVFAQTSDNQLSVLKTAANLCWDRCGDSQIILCDGSTDTGYPGYLSWARLLLSFGVPSGSILGLQVEENVNTLSEATTLVKLASSQNKKNIIIICPPFHQARAFMTTVSESLRLGLNLNIYNNPADPEDWTKTVFHSQGTLKDSRSGLIKAEIERIEKYTRQGDIAESKDIIAYLNKRK